MNEETILPLLGLNMSVLVFLVGGVHIQKKCAVANKGVKNTGLMCFQASL